MSKAILVMDMPTSCAKCPFVKHEDEGWLYCGIHNNDTAFAFKRAEYCPLKSMPEKKEKGSVLETAIKNNCFDGSTEDRAYFNGKERGYNTCIEDILNS